MTNEQVASKDPTQIEGIDGYLYEPGYSFDLPYQVPWELFDRLKARGGENKWYCGGLLLISFPTREQAKSALRESVREHAA